ncbi:MAG: site-specific DNA-methyltransferase [Clostridia bacterium]|nr:site-specific DNA-methyltransferase [Clostridia bacterium]
MLNKFFEGEGDGILEMVFNNNLSVSQAKIIRDVVDKHTEKFPTEEAFRKICDPKFDYSRLEYGITYLDLNDDTEYSLFRSYLLKDITLQDFHKSLQQMGKVEQRINNHEDNKTDVQIVDEVYKTDNAYLIRGNNREVEFKHPFKKEIQCLIGSPPYGNRRLNSDDPDADTGHGMTGQEYGVYLAETYEGYKIHMAKDGSIYVIIDDYRMKNGAHACSLEHFVVEMEKRGFFLVGRYTWVKDNPMPRSYTDKDMVNGFEMVYRFSLDPKNYYCNPDMFIELGKGENEGFREGCTNTDGKGKTSRGSSYYQSHLKKLRNTLDERNCTDIIRGNVCNPMDFFRQTDEKKHTSQSPLYLTSTLILESTRPDDLVVDIWNGVGNTMDSALLLGRKYVGIELEEDYFQQSCRRADITESILSINTPEDLAQAA